MPVVKISELPVGATLAADDVLLVVQAAGTRKATAHDLRAYMIGSIVPADIGAVPATRGITVTGLLSGGGALSGNVTIGLAPQTGPVVLGIASGTAAPSALSAPMLGVITAADTAAARTALGLGSIATADAAAYQPLDADLSSIAGLAGTAGLLRKTAANTWALDTTAYSTLTLGSMDGAALGTAAAGSASTAARSDHVHPVQTSVSGNAGTATKLAAPVTINGVSFDGSAGITVADGTKLPLTGGTLTGAIAIRGASGFGSLGLFGGDATHPGYLEFRTGDGVRRGYIGWSNSANRIDIESENGWRYNFSDIVSCGGTNVSLEGHTHAYLPLTGGTLTGQLASSVATGTAPFSVASTTTVTNLSADLLDGLDSSQFMRSQALSKDDITTRTDSGFWQTNSATKANGWPEDANDWYHLLTSTHSNVANYYSMQFAGRFFDSSKLYYRATNGSGTAPWVRIWTSAAMGAGSGLDADTLRGVAPDMSVSGGTIVQRDWGGGMAASAVTTYGGAPIYEMYESDAPAENKRWRVVSDGGVQYYQTVNDAYNQVANWLEVHRNGLTPTSADFKVQVTVAGALKVGSRASAVGSESLLISPSSSSAAGATVKLALANSGSNDGSPNVLYAGVDGAALWGTAFLDTGAFGVANATALELRVGGAAKVKVSASAVDIQALVSTSSLRVGSGADTRGDVTVRNGSAAYSGGDPGDGRRGVSITSNAAGAVNVLCMRNIANTAFLDIVENAGALTVNRFNSGGYSALLELSAAGNLSLLGSLAAPGATFTAPDQIRLKAAATGANYGLVMRQDGGTFYLLCTNNNDADGAWNALRPFYFSLSDGVVGLGNGAVVSSLFRPGADNAVSLGSASYRWSTIYAATGTINTSDARQKIDLGSDPLGLDFVLSLRPRAYRWRGGRRVHTGLFAQEVRAVVPDGLDWAGWTLADPANQTSLQGLRLDQLWAPTITSIQALHGRQEAAAARIDIITEQQKDAAERIAALEAEVSGLRARLAA